MGEAGRLVILDTFGLAFAGDTSQDLMTTYLVRTWYLLKGGVFEVIAPENTSKRSALETMADLFLPKTLVGRLTVLGFIFGIISGNTPYEISWLPGLMAFLVWAWAFAVAVRNSLREKGRRAVCLLRTLAGTAGVIVGYFALGELVKALAFMAAGGSGTLTFNLLDPTSPGSFGGIEVCLALVTVVLLFWIPHMLFRIQLDMTGAGDSQRVLLSLITIISCIVTAVCFLLLHFGGGPLRDVHTGTLVVGAIGTVLLVAHPYRSLAKACWQRGIAGVCNPRVLKQHWSNMTTELGKTLDSAARDTRPSTAPDPDGRAA